MDRRHPVHLDAIERFNMPVIVFVTRLREKSKADPGHSCDTCAPAKGVGCSRSLAGWSLHDHARSVYFFCAPADQTSMGLAKWISFRKSSVTKAWPNGNGAASVWQRHFWDRQLRQMESYAQKWD